MTKVDSMGLGNAVGVGSNQKDAILNVLNSGRISNNDDDAEGDNFKQVWADVNVEGDGNQKNDIEISDDEAPDIEEAKQKLRDQHQKRRDKNRGTDVQGVEGSMQVQVADDR